MTGPSDFNFRWANVVDEPDIRALVGSVAMPGAVSMCFVREPDYFLGTTIMGDTCDVLLVRNQSDGRLAGIACRAERSAYINGEKARLGYFGQIRIAPEFQGRWLIQRGAQFLRDDSPPDLLYMGVIASDNPVALKILTGPRLPGGLFVRHLASLTTCAILLRPRCVLRVPGIDISLGTPEVLGEIVGFLNEEGSKRQFYPAYMLEDFTGGERMRGIDPADILVARREGAIVGVIAVWDQSAYKQEIIYSYGAGLRRLAPLYDLAARVLGARPLTPPGAEIPMAFAACICVAGDEDEVMRGLLSAATANAYERGKSFLMIGLADRDPLLAVARRYLHIPYHSELFAATWSQALLDLLDERVPYIEIGAL